jgi:hypothetical protein
LQSYANTLDDNQKEVASEIYDKMVADGHSEDEILQLFNSQGDMQNQSDSGGFNQPLSMGENGSNQDLDKLAGAIGQYESGGRYNALGPVMPSGSYAGDRAYGKYQVMGKNIPSWTKQALGYSMTPQQFLRDTAAQDATAKHFMKQHLDRYGRPEDVASMWLSGKPMQGNNARDLATGVTVPQYVQNVMKYYNG